MTTTTRRSPVPTTTLPPAARAPGGPLDLDAMLRVLFGESPTGLLRLAARGGHADSEAFFRWSAARGWTWPLASGQDRPLDFLARHSTAALGWSPLVFASPQTGGPVTVPVAWVAFAHTLIPHPALPRYAAVDPVSEAASVATVAALRPIPTVVLDSGAKVFALWTLSAPLTITVADHLLNRLALALGTDRESVVLWRTTTLVVPGTLASGIIPARRVTAHGLGQAAVTLEQLDRIA